MTLSDIITTSWSAVRFSLSPKALKDIVVPVEVKKLDGAYVQVGNNVYPWEQLTVPMVWTKEDNTLPLGSAEDVRKGVAIAKSLMENVINSTIVLLNERLGINSERVIIHEDFLLDLGEIIVFVSDAGTLAYRAPVTTIFSVIPLHSNQLRLPLNG